MSPRPDDLSKDDLEEIIELTDVIEEGPGLAARGSGEGFEDELASLLDGAAGAKATKAPVAFSHAKHKAVECTKCHHKWDGKAAKADMKCASKGCHDNMASKKAGENSYYNAYHDMKAENSCLGCHKAMKKAGKPTGPNACNDCHPVQK